MTPGQAAAGSAGPIHTTEGRQQVSDGQPASVPTGTACRCLSDSQAPVFSSPMSGVLPTSGLRGELSAGEPCVRRTGSLSSLPWSHPELREPCKVLKAEGWVMHRLCNLATMWPGRSLALRFCGPASPPYCERASMGPGHFCDIFSNMIWSGMRRISRGCSPRRAPYRV